VQFRNEYQREQFMRTAQLLEVQGLSGDSDHNRNYPPHNKLKVPYSHPISSSQINKHQQTSSQPETISSFTLVKRRKINIQE
jgi:hypothetical protein